MKPFPALLVIFATVFLYAAPGPVTTDGRFLAAINIDYPGLTAVRTAALAGDTAAALTAFCNYFRGRTSVPWTFDPQHVDRTIGYNKALADTTVSGYVLVIDIWYHFPGGAIDWLFNATTANAAMPDNNEWQWQLNRMEFWDNLGKAYWGSADERYAQTFADHVRTWSIGCPMPADNGN
jgi:hypothetical protein